MTSMDFNTFQELSKRTMNLSAGCTMNATLGLAGEVGELVDLVKKVHYHGHELDLDKFAEELGDVLFYVAFFAEAYCLSLDAVAAHNVEKLKARYPDGFSEERSRNRGDTAEEG